MSEKKKTTTTKKTPSKTSSTKAAPKKTTAAKKPVDKKTTTAKKTTAPKKTSTAKKTPSPTKKSTATTKKPTTTTKKPAASKPKTTPKKAVTESNTIRAQIVSYKRSNRLQITNQAIAVVLDDYNPKALVGKNFVINFAESEATAKGVVVKIHGQIKNKRLRLRFLNAGMAGSAINQIAEIKI